MDTGKDALDQLRKENTVADFDCLNAAVKDASDAVAGSGGVATAEDVAKDAKPQVRPPHAQVLVMPLSHLSYPYLTAIQVRL